MIFEHTASVSRNSAIHPAKMARFGSVPIQKWEIPTSGIRFPTKTHARRTIQNNRIVENAALEWLCGIGCSFAEMLEATIRKCQNRTIEAAQVIAELIELAKKMREGQKRGQELGLTDDEVAFYDALEVNDSAVKVLGEPTLKNIARELVSHVRKSVTIDWPLRESAQAPNPGPRPLRPGRQVPAQTRLPTRQTGKSHQTVLGTAGSLLCADGRITRIFSPSASSAVLSVRIAHF
jgi:hypothetical protein